jgi:mono/diheme cytochrome c family protein
MRVSLLLTLLVSAAARAADLPAPTVRPVDFVKDIQPVFKTRCYDCHGPKKQKGELRLDVKSIALKGGESGAVIVPGKSADSKLIQLVAGKDPDNVMPPKGERLTREQITLLRAWIDQGAKWPDDASAKSDPADHWAYKPIKSHAPPTLTGDDAKWVRNPIDAFVLAKLKEKGLRPSAQADRRTLIRRVYFDLTGLPPAPEEVDRFIADERPDAYERVVDALLASPRYGERWARHWLDVVHYGDTHGYDKDKVRPNAWPYRDYVIRSLNEDKPYERFVKEQLAGDYFYPGTSDGVIALGFIAAGPWDFVGHAELREGTIDKAITRNLDRDDMVAVTMNTFVSSTAQCARCHNHKFDPISQEDYYSLQAVFAAVDRADRAFDEDPAIAKQRIMLEGERSVLRAYVSEVERKLQREAGQQLAFLDRRIAVIRAARSQERPEFGYHSRIERKQDVTKWVQVDLEARIPINRIVLVGAHDPYGGIGAGFGFPVRYKIEVSEDAEFKKGVTVVDDHTAADVKNPGVEPQTIVVDGRKVRARYVRLTATRLAERTKDYVLALGEMQVLAANGTNYAVEKEVSALDSIEAPLRWRKSNLVDGYYYGIGNIDAPDSPLAQLQAERQKLVERIVGDAVARKLRSVEQDLAAIDQRLSSLPRAKGLVFAAATHFKASGAFTPNEGKPRAIHLLKRGSEKDPDHEVGPGTMHAVPDLPTRFELLPSTDESERRAALATWIVDRRNPPTWRSIVNRVWQYHFGKGIVETPNDFGHMGASPTHPELLDWLATEFRDGGKSIKTPQSLKSLHRLVVTSSTYRQSSADNAEEAKIDAGNQFLWRMNRQKLEAEAIHDSILQVAGKLDLTMGGPGYRDFGFEDDHSPRYKYNESDPDDPKTQRRSIYRLIVRSVPNPFMETLDCADPSQIVAKRNETLTALQALALLNNKFILRMAEHLAERVTPLGKTDEERAAAAFRIAIGRNPKMNERWILGDVAAKDGLPNTCRVLFNLNEFTFVD